MLTHFNSSRMREQRSWSMAEALYGSDIGLVRSLMDRSNFKAPCTVSDKMKEHIIHISMSGPPAK